MGNEHSSLPGLELDERAVEVTDYWAHHSATVKIGNSISVFIGEPLVNGLLWASQTPLEKTTKSLMVYRHPCILKYISSWHKSSKFYLAVEDVKPLSLVLSSQNTLQICVGLHSILKALCFLHEKACVSHNNICVQSIYVTKDGNWRLGGMEYLCRFMDLTEEYLSKTRKYRYSKAIDINESKSIKDRNERPYAIDCYAYGQLVNEVLQNCTEDNMSSISNFQDFCKSELQNPDVSLRPKLTSLLKHEFFTHEFITIYSFLTELPLKSDEEKVQFFSSLTNKLRKFNEFVVANQLGSLLLSRMVLLDATAQQDVLPFLLCPRQSAIENADSLFSIDNFKQFIIPRLLQIFCVRDAQIRLLLLEHFTYFKNCFSVDELQSQILPELLVGIKDTNDHLVAVTLRALADMIPILGAATVIGGKRAKLFNDGRPMTLQSRKPRRNSRKNIDNNAVQVNLITEDVATSTVEINHDLELPERPSPDGEEGESSTEDVEESVQEDLDNWEDWGVNETNSPLNNGIVISNENTHLNNDKHLSLNIPDNTEETDIISSRSIQELPNERTQLVNTMSLQLNNSLKFPQQRKKGLLDISELDIKNQTSAGTKLEEVDFFQDMEPIIDSSAKYLFVSSQEENGSNTFEIQSRILDLSVADLDKHEEGWDDDCDWD